jgi:uncharacterized protein YggE
MKVKENKSMAVLVVLFLALFFLPIDKIRWGKISWQQSETITVTGEAKSVQKNQIATFNAGVDSVQSDKDKAIKEVNTKVEELVKAVKSFGISETEIKTQNLSVYQQEEYYTENGTQRTRKGQWRVNNSVEIVLKEVDRASALVTLLTSSGATNVYGPNFSFEDTSEAEKDLFKAAMTDAKEKAEMLAKASDRKVGKVVNIIEGNSTSNSPIYGAKMMDGMGGTGAVVEVGSGTVSQTLTVVFELK